MRMFFLTGLMMSALAGCAQTDATDDGTENLTAEEIRLRDLTGGRVFRFDHYLPVTGGARLHVIEKFTATSVLRAQKRGMLMLTGTFVTNEQYNADVPGNNSYNALDRAACAGYFAFSASYEGYGESSRPADGSAISFDRLTQQMGDTVEWIRRNRLVNKVDLLGASVGSGLALQLGSTNSPINRNHVGKIILTANIYKGLTPEFAAAFGGLAALLSTAPNGYFTTIGDVYFPVIASATPEAQAWALSTFPGVYSTGPTLVATSLPIVEGSTGRAPVLQFWGDQDLITPRSDVDQFQAEYAGPHGLVVIPGGGHAPYYEAGREQFWRDSFAFLGMPTTTRSHYIDGNDCNFDQ